MFAPAQRGCTIAFMSERERLLDMMRRLHARRRLARPFGEGGARRRRPSTAPPRVPSLAVTRSGKSPFTSRRGETRSERASAASAPAAPEQGDWQHVTDTSAEAWQRTLDALDASSRRACQRGAESLGCRSRPIARHRRQPGRRQHHWADASRDRPARRLPRGTDFVAEEIARSPELKLGPTYMYSGLRTLAMRLCSYAPRTFCRL